MGEPKHLLRAGGQTWLEQTVATVGPHVAAVVLLGRGAVPAALADLPRLPDVPEQVIARYPRIAAGIRGLRDAGLRLTHQRLEIVRVIAAEDWPAFRSFVERVAEVEGRGVRVRLRPGGP